MEEKRQEISVKNPKKFFLDIPSENACLVDDISSVFVFSQLWGPEET